MASFKSAVALAAALLPTALAQANTTYIDYNTASNPSLEHECLEHIPYAFPDCESGPLAGTLVCDTSATPEDRATALISLFTFEELANNTGNVGFGVERLGLPGYNVWMEGLHGIDRANFTAHGQEWSYGTSFPMPILFASALNRTLVNQIAGIISTQGRAFNNVGRYGLDAYTPNINAFRHPVWGRGAETPGEDAAYLVSQYAYEYITGLQGGVDTENLKFVATAKHFAGYDIESYGGHSRLGNDLVISQQDLSEYYTPQFLVASRDAKVHSFMCSYNAVNGVPSCSNSFFLKTLLRDTFQFDPSGYVSADCGAVYGVYNPHEYAFNETSASADSLRAGTDIDCGTSFPWTFDSAFDEGLVSREDVERALIRLYTNLVRMGYFDGPSAAYRNLGWNDVVETDSWNIAYEAAVEGIVLLKNDNTLPLSNSVKSVALIGPWANATGQLQGSYYGTAPYLISPLQAFTESNLTVNYALGTAINSTNTTGFAAAIDAAKKSDVIIYLGGIDQTVEAEAMDRTDIIWPGNQLDLIEQLSNLHKPLVVLQMGGGQVDSSSLKANKNVNSLVWGGYPGQSGGYALRDIITGKRAPAGRLTTTQYPAEYLKQFSPLDASLRPDSNGNPGQTYIWYTGQPVYEFGYGLFYTTFGASLAGPQTTQSFNITELLAAPHPGYSHIDQVPFLNVTVKITNTGKTTSDYTAMLFADTKNAGPAPYPNKWLVGFDRLGDIAPHASQTLTFPVTLGSVARTDAEGNRVLYPGNYELALNPERSVVVSFTLTGNPGTILNWPKETQEITQA